MTALASNRAVRDPETVRTAWFLLLAGALVVGAWLALAWWSASPYSRYVTHGG